MANPQTLRVEVVHARSDAQHLVELHLVPGATVRDAVRLSGLVGKFPELDTSTCKLGIFSKPVAPEHVLHDGDRVEIYRPLKADPKEARRERAQGQRRINRGTRLA